MRDFKIRNSRFWFLPCVALMVSSPFAWADSEGNTPAGNVEFLGGPSSGVAIKHQQQWGDFGLNTAAARPGTKGSPMRIGQQTFEQGLGHHANGEIAIDLNGQYTSFSTFIGVQWQGGGKGSVVFQISVDGRKVFASEPMSDSDPGREVQVPLKNARKLLLTVSDNGDGIANDMGNWAKARLVRDPKQAFFETATSLFNGRPAPPNSAAVGGFSLVADESGPQIVVMEPAGMFTVSVRRGEEVKLIIPVRNSHALSEIAASLSITHGKKAEVGLSFGDESVHREIGRGEDIGIAVSRNPQANSKAGDPGSGNQSTIVLTTRGVDDEAGVRWHFPRYKVGEQSFQIPVEFEARAEQIPPRALPSPRQAIGQEMIEWDWRMQDGIGTAREARTWAQATGKVLQQGEPLIRKLLEAGVDLQSLLPAWNEARQEWKDFSTAGDTSEARWENLWRRVHQVRRQIAFENPLANFGPLVFAKQVPSNFSHQLTQYYGMCARPGGGIFRLDAPGKSMQARPLGELPMGSYQHPEVSWDGQRILFAFCKTDAVPTDREEKEDLHYSLFEMATDGSNLRQLTDGPYDDFSPRQLPDGKILFISTRRGGYHRCGKGPCPVYTMAIADSDGSNPRVISYHETQEWDPAVLNDGRVIYTRWDYVDRNAVHYQQLWTVRPDGSNVGIFYGNNTFNPVGVWEARPVPDSPLVMATAAAHHAMTAGSIILIDVRKGVDNLEPITRLTPDALFPESESPVGRWHATAGISSPPPVPIEEQRWPGHCYRTPYPLSEDFFLASYSFDPLVGEPHANSPNMFGIYLVDRFGNKELIYRDPNIGSLWPTPIRERQRPPHPASTPLTTAPQGTTSEGTFFVHNVQQSWPQLPEGPEDRITHLRILQILPKTTPHSNTPRVGLANASPGKQVLGTVPVESDGSAYFRAPAKVPLSFQALDKRGMAVQTMRSLTYLQPGEQSTCIGCHERRGTAPTNNNPALALQRSPSTIAPGPDGSRPFSYPLLVQPVLDKHCVSCHSEKAPAGGIALTGAAAGKFSQSYTALAPLVSFSEWNSTPKANGEPATHPGQFGARASKLMALLQTGHEGVKLAKEDIERLITWMDANALFYGTFDPADQKRQQQGERIAGPALE